MPFNVKYGQRYIDPPSLPPKSAKYNTIDRGRNLPDVESARNTASYESRQYKEYTWAVCNEKEELLFLFKAGTEIWRYAPFVPMRGGRQRGT